MLYFEIDPETECPSERRKLRRHQLDDQLAQPIYSLPAELIMNIIDHMSISELPSAIAGLYHLLVTRHIVPDLPPRTLSWARGLLGWPLELISNNVFFPRHHTQRQLPVELTLQIQQYLSPQDKINLVLAIYQIPCEAEIPQIWMSDLA